MYVRFSENLTYVLNEWSHLANIRCGPFLINPFLANVSILCPLKAPENLWLSGVFWGSKMFTLARKCLSTTRLDLKIKLQQT